MIVGGPALLALALAAAGEPHDVEVELLASRPSFTATVTGPSGRRDVAARDGVILLDGAPRGAAVRLPAGRWRIRLPDASERRFEGALEIATEGGGRLRFVARLDLEEYVAWTVASEADPGAPVEALRAQAVVARSYALAAGRRHGGAALCDLAHCQVLRGGLDAGRLAAARRAAEATRGEVLRLPDGRVALAPFHAACGGHTGDPAQLFGGDGTGALAVPDPDCPRMEWRAVVPEPVLEAVIRDRLGQRGGSYALGDLEWRRGAGGYVVQVALGAGVVGGEAFARALDARLGHRTIRSSRFTVSFARDGVRFEGSGVGHGAGLCQLGAARRARAGGTWREILAHYFPLARPGR